MYTHILPSGETIHIDAAALRKVLLRMHSMELRARTFNVAIEARNFWAMLEERQFDPRRCTELALRCPGRWNFEPLIWGLWGSRPDDGHGAFLMDGHHRYALAVVRGEKDIPSWLIPRYVWEDFLVPGPQMTREQLRDLPPTHRSY